MLNEKIEAMGCCGAYCGKCKEFEKKLCAGCKIGYKNQKRDINKAKCKVKKCCLLKKYNSCADCHEYDNCVIINEFYSKNGYKYKKYKEALDFIKMNGYSTFFEIAEKWNMQYGKY